MSHFHYSSARFGLYPIQTRKFSLNSLANKSDKGKFEVTTTKTPNHRERKIYQPETWTEPKIFKTEAEGKEN